MRLLRLTIAALLLGGVLAPLGPHALAHALEFAHSHRHSDGTDHSHDHDADHHRDDDSMSSCEARVIPARTTARTNRESITAVLPSSPYLGCQAAGPSPATLSRSGAPPGRRPSPHHGRAPPA